MPLLTNVTLNLKPIIYQNKAKFNAECQEIKTDYLLELEYDGRDVLITPPAYSRIEITKWCQLLVGLFHEKSNFKQLLFKTFSFLPCKKKLECIFFEVNGIIICISTDSNPYDLMRSYYRQYGDVVLDNDTEQQIKDRNKKLHKLHLFVYRRFLKESDFSDFEEHRKRIFFLSEEEEQAYKIKECAIYDKRFYEYLKNFELDSESSEESKQLLILLKKQLMH